MSDLKLSRVVIGHVRRFLNQAKISPNADCPASRPINPGITEPLTCPLIPGICFSLISSSGVTMMSQVDVPTILTILLELMPAPIAPACASMRPTVTCTSLGNLRRFAHSTDSLPADTSLVYV